MKARLSVLGMTPVVDGPAQLARDVEVESAKWEKVIRERKLSVD